MAPQSEGRLPEVVKVPDHVLFRRLGDETVLLNLDTETYFALDGVGSRLFELLGADGEVGPAVDSLVAEYDVERPRLVDDLTELLADLVTAGLVVTGGDVDR